MKRLFLIPLFIFTCLWAFEFNADSWGTYLIFEPDQRETLLSYPTSWLQPGTFLMDQDYQDSSYTYGLWEQIMTTDETAGYYLGTSNHIIAKYVPYSTPRRWSAGLEFINYKGANSTYRTDAVLNYRNSKGIIQYYQTSNTQKIRLTSGGTEHIIKAHSLSFDYSLNDKLKLNGSININKINQKDASETRNYDIDHEKVSLNYSILESLSAYGTFHYWNYRNDDREGTELLFYPGLLFNYGIINSHLSLRVSPSTLHPIFELSVKPGPLYVQAFTKARSPRIDLQQETNQYLGIKSGLSFNSVHHELNADVTYTYDIVRTTQGDSIVNNDFETFKARGEYRFKTKPLDIYAKGYYQNAVNPRAAYYHPVRSILTGGVAFRAGLAKGKLLLSGDLNAQYILHDDPDMVSFDPSKLIYTLNSPANLVSDWKANFNLKAGIGDFAISAEVDLPLKFDVSYNFGEIFTSSEFYFGNTFYAGLTIEWLWWK